MHRNIYRGKNLGDTFTDEQKAAIKDGTFHDLWVGDYWTMSNSSVTIIKSVKWRIVDIDYWYGIGEDVSSQKKTSQQHHIVIMPDDGLESLPMNDDGDAKDKYYLVSDLRTTKLENIKNRIYSDFGETCIYNHRERFTNSSSSGVVSSTIEVPNEIMMFGAFHFAKTEPTSGTYGITLPEELYTSSGVQLALFRMAPSFLSDSRSSYACWLRDKSSAGSIYFTTIDRYGQPGFSQQSNSLYVRPCFGLVDKSIT